MTTLAAAGPSVKESSALPTRCPLVAPPTGKLIIWAANTNAPITPSSGSFLLVKLPLRPTDDVAGGRRYGHVESGPYRSRKESIGNMHEIASQ